MKKSLRSADPNELGRSITRYETLKLKKAESEVDGMDKVEVVHLKI